MKALGRWCFRHRKLVLTLWLIVLVATFAADRATHPAFSSKFTLPNTQSNTAVNLLQQDFPKISGDTDQIVLHARTGTVRAPAVEAAAERMLREVAALPHVSSVASPYAAPGGAQISRDGTIAFAAVHFDEQATSLTVSAINRVIDTAQAAQSPTLQVALGGQAIEQTQMDSSSASTIIGIVFALVVVGIAFGALFAAFLPLITALAGIGIGYAVTGLLTHAFSVASFSTILGVLIGLGVGVDYSLFIVSRHRSGLLGGKSVEDSAVQAVNTSGRAVLFAGLIVCISLLGQFALGISFLYGVATAAAITVALVMLSALTLLPALLGFFGLKVLSRKQRARLAATGPVTEEATGFWRRWATGIERHPVLPSIAAVAVMVVIALPFFSLRLGLDDAGSDPAGSTTRIAYDLLDRGFGPGFNGPLELVGQLRSPADEGTFAALVATAARQPGVVASTPPQVSPNGKLAVASLYPATSPQAQQTSTLLDRLRNDIIPRAETGSGLTVVVGGTTAVQHDFSQVLSGKLPLFVAVVVILAFILLVAVFRSLLIPLTASVMNLLSVGAALGILNAVFDWGWGHSLIGVSGDNPVEVFIPVLLFSILFGLSMDYQVFLVSRMHEYWQQTRDNRTAVTLGQAETGRVITAAATIMILVFASFVFGGSIVIKQFGIGLATAVILDAFIIRTVLVPAVMHLSGNANWWLPRWLDRIVPRLSIDPEDDQPEATGPAMIPIGPART
jgi:RND superfamily putative drug exporter